MNTVEQIERMIEQLPTEDFKKLSAWMDERRPVPVAGQKDSEPLVLRDHQAFLNSYKPEDEGLYDDAESR